MASWSIPGVSDEGDARMATRAVGKINGWPNVSLWFTSLRLDVISSLGNASHLLCSDNHSTQHHRHQNPGVCT